MRFAQTKPTVCRYRLKIFLSISGKCFDAWRGPCRWHYPNNQNCLVIRVAPTTQLTPFAVFTVCRVRNALMSDLPSESLIGAVCNESCLHGARACRGGNPQFIVSKPRVHSPWIFFLLCHLINDRKKEERKGSLIQSSEGLGYGDAGNCITIDQRLA